MWKVLANMQIKKFDNFLKFAKKIENPERFKVFPRGGIDIFYNERKVAMIYLIISSTKDFRRGDIVINTDISDKKRDLLQNERIRMGEKIWIDLIKQYEKEESL